MELLSWIVLFVAKLLLLIVVALSLWWMYCFSPRLRKLRGDDEMTTLSLNSERHKSEERQEQVRP